MHSFEIIAFDLETRVRGHSRSLEMTQFDPVWLAINDPLTDVGRPRRRRLEEFTTDANIIRLISRRVAFFWRRRRGSFSTAIATQLIL